MMARKLRDNYNIDLLRLCYQQPDGLFEMIVETKPNTSIGRDGYYLFVIGEEDGDDSPNSILCNIVADSGEEIGTITFNSSKSKYGKRCFVRLDNKALYTVISRDFSGNKGNMICYIDYIADDLGLEFLSITELHIANDSNINKIAKVMKMKRDIEHFDLIINRKRVEKGTKLPNSLKCTQMLRERDVNPSIRIEQKKKDAPKVFMYNKSIEIKEESGKEYINEWNDFGKQTIYRSELRLRWEYLKEYFDERGIKGYGVFNAILLPKTLEEIFEHFTSRLIYFRNKQTDEVVTIYNLS